MRVGDTCARVLLVASLAACSEIHGQDPAPSDDGGGGDGDVDAAGSEPGGDAGEAALGTEGNPAASCGELRAALGPESGVYWVTRPDDVGEPFQVYCEQEINQGGWAMLYNSVLTDAGVTLAFWQFAYLERFQEMGTPDPAENYYRGSLYLIGADYMDVVVDLDDKLVVAAIVSTGGIDTDTMAFTTPALTAGNTSIFNSQFAGGWSSSDHDSDTYVDGNCAGVYGSVAQHYSACWSYNLGADGDLPHEDSGVGPHVNKTVLTALGLSSEAVGSYSRVKRIARFTRW